MKKSIYNFLLLLLGIMGLLLLSEFIIDFYFGNRDGIIKSFHLSKIITGVTVLSLTILLFTISYLFRNQLIFSVAAIISLLLIIEFISLLILKLNTTPVFYEHTEAFITSDSLLGHKSIPNQTTYATCYTKRDTIFRAKYSIDQNGMRNSVLKDSLRPSSFALFLGGSTTFGFGLNDAETLPSLFQNQTFKSYNLGCNGYGSNHVLKYLETQVLGPQIKEKSGIGIYVFIEDHLRRSVGTLRNRTKEIYYLAPEYYLKGDTLIQNKNFHDAQNYLQKKISHLISFSYFLQLINFDWPIKLSEDQFRLNGKIIDQIANQFKVQFPAQAFYLLIYPGEDNRILDYIQNPEINILDYSGLFERGVFSIPFDGHPTLEGNMLVAKQLTRDLSQ